MSLYIKFTITENNGETEHDETMVAEIPEETTVSHLQRALDAFLLDWYSDCEWENDEHIKVWTSHNTLCWISDDEQLRCEAVFDDLREHMNNQTFNVNVCLTKTA